MSVLDFYADRMEEIQIEGKETEKALITRRGRSTDSRVINDEKKIMLKLGTNIACGDVITRKDGSRFFITAKQSSGCVECQGRRINALIGIYKLENQYEDYELIGSTEVEIKTDIPTYYKDVSAIMKNYDVGLLKDTVKIVLIKNTEEIDELYRVKLNGASYQVDNIDTGRYENMYYIQLSEDTRAVDNG